MIRRFLTSAVFLGFWVCHVHAQNSLFITDSETGTPLFGAHVKFSESRVSEKHKFEVSDNTGKVPVPYAVTYAANISFVGYKTVDTVLTPGNHTIRLQMLQTMLKPVQLVSDFIPRGEDAMVQKVTVIDRQRIENQGAQNLRDLLSNDLNIRLSQDNSLGSFVSMQGVGGANVKILIDGVPVIGRLDGNIDLSQINLNNIERVEIIQGPASAAYGTNALGGIINLITKKETAKTIEVGATGYYESVGQYNADGYFSASAKGHTFRASGGRYFFDGYRNIDSTRAMQWKPKRQFFGEVQYAYKLKELQFRYAGSYFNEKIENKGKPNLPFGVDARDEYYITDRINNTIAVTGFVKPKHHLDFTANYSIFVRNVNTYQKDLVTLNKSLLENTRDKFDLIMSRGIYSYSGASEKLLVQAGYDINYETGSGPRIKNGTQNIGDYAGFASAEYTAWKRLTLKPSLRYGYNSRFRMPVIPSFSLKVQAHKYVQIRAGYSRGFRAPDLKELFFEFVDINHNIIGNEALKAETSHNLTGSLTFRMNKKNYAFSIEPSGFYNDILNRISLVYTGQLSSTGVQIYTNRNVGRYRATGARINLTFNYKGLSVAGGFTYTGVSQNVAAQDAGQPFLYYPEARGNVAYTWEKGGLTGNVFYKFTGRQPFLYTDETSQTVQGYIQGFHTLDLSVTKTFFKKSLRISVYGKNLLNVRNLVQSGVSSEGGAHSSNSTSVASAWGRTVAVAVSYNFAWSKKKK